MLDIRWLEDFLAIADTGSITKAAELRAVSQSGLSRRVQSLEHWAGAALIDRNAVPLKLTEAGRDLHPVAAQVTLALAQVRRKVTERAHLDAKVVRLTAPHLLSTSFFPEWLPRISQVGGNSDIVVVSQNLLNCFEALDRADVHFVVCLADAERSVFNRIPEAIRADPDMIAKVASDKLIPVSGTGADGAAKYSLEDREAPFLHYTPECSLAWTVDDLLRAHPHLALRKISTNPFADGLRLMVLGGVGVAWLPESLVARDLSEGSMVRLGEEQYDIPLDVVVIRPSYRLTSHAERIWRSISEGKVLDGKAGPPRLHVVG